MEKRYIAFNGGANSGGPSTYEHALKWATDQLAKNAALQAIYICEAISVVERKTPPIEVRPYMPPVVEAKSAAA